MSNEMKNKRIQVHKTNKSRNVDITYYFMSDPSDSVTLDRKNLNSMACIIQVETALTDKDIFNIFYRNFSDAS